MYLLANHSEYSRRYETGVVSYMGHIELKDFENQQPARLGNKTIKALSEAQFPFANVFVREGYVGNEETVISYELLPRTHEVLNFRLAASRRRELCDLIAKFLAGRGIQVIMFVPIVVRV